MNGSCPSRCLLMAYSIFVLLLPWATYAAAPDSGPADLEQSIASIYDAMAQPILWQQQKITIKGNRSDTQQDAAADEPDESAVGSALPNVRPVRAYVSILNTPPHLHINLPSWRGLIPYNIPPPTCLPA